ncbi:hypothetical protein BN982_02580 [Halobacillus karajensis]|nr:hypothetical protein BN982_02580 [Halobacillus karajensis]CDQ28559.1 hypothetical protein BN981_02867 [Halobacillus karajensis]
MLDILKKKIVTAFITFFVSIPAYWIIFPDSRGNLFITLVLIIGLFFGSILSLITEFIFSRYKIQNLTINYLIHILLGILLDFIFIDNGPKLKIFLVIVFPVLTVYFIIYRIIDKKSSH